MIVRYDPVESKLSIDTGRGTTMEMVGSESDIIAEVLDYIADHPEEWHLARRSAALILDGLEKERKK